ncbi:hypothetical protein BDL97_14G090700, partial [Sphagnum fallax]
PSNFPTWTHNDKIIWILCTTFSFSILLGGIICWVTYWKYHKNALVLCEIQKEFAKQQVQPTLYSYCVIKVATKDFHCDNELGQGGFGVVYKTMKLLTQKSHQKIDDVLNENLVTLQGCCLHGTQCLLVFKFVEKNNLASTLWGPKINNILFLTWPIRFKICVGMVRGLDYLHEDLQPCIIHQNIKASNILLHKNFNAKIIVGTIGYISPKYATFGQLSTKLDVYSFGILLLEIAWSLYKNNNLSYLIDQRIKNTIVEHEVQCVINVAFLCVQQEATRRPLMSHVLAMLQGEMDL